MELGLDPAVSLKFCPALRTGGLMKALQGCAFSAILETWEGLGDSMAGS